MKPEEHLDNILKKTGVTPMTPNLENDFYEVLPIINSNLTVDGKVSQVKKVFEKLLSSHSHHQKKRLVERVEKMLKEVKPLNSWGDFILDSDKARLGTALGQQKAFIDVLDLLKEE